MSSLTQKAIPTKSLASENAYGKSKSPSPLPIRERKTLDIEGFEHTSFDFGVNAHSHNKKAVNQTKLIQTWGGVTNFTLLKSDCPICGGFRNGKKKHDCKRSGELIHCFSHNEPPSGWICTGQSAIGQSLYAPAKGKDFDSEKHRAELARLRAEHQAKEAKRRAELPTIPERHQEILKFKAELTEAQNTDLLIRGLFQEEIDLALANHWLFACKGGFGIAATDPVTGLLCGAQRAKDDRSPKYDWGIFTGKNQLKETGENPLAVWVCPDFDPTQPYESKFTEGFLKSLIRALMEWRKNPQVIVIGAAGGIFGKNSIKRVLSVYDEAAKQTLLPDKNSQNLKKLNIYSGYQGLTHLIPEIKFADWGQWRDETRGDCDETYETKSFNRYKRRSPWQWLKFFTFPEDVKREKDRLKKSTKLTANLTLTTKQFRAILNSPNPWEELQRLSSGATDIFLRGGMGLGKTELAKRILALFTNALAPIHRRSLAIANAEAMKAQGFRYRTDCDQYQGEMFDSDGYISKISFCLEAILGLKRPITNILKSKTIVFNDEFDQQLESLYTSSTHGKDGKRKLHQDLFWEMQRKAARTFSVSADLSDWDIGMFADNAGRKPFVIDVVKEKKNHSVSVFEASEEWFEQFDGELKSQKKPIVFSTRKEDIKFLRYAFDAVGICADNAVEFRHFFDAPNDYLRIEKPSLLAINSVAGTGLSITESHFDSIFLYAHPDNQSAREVMQLLNRYRPNVPIYIYCGESSNRFYRLTPEECFKARFVQAKANQAVDENFISIDEQDPVFHYQAEKNRSLAYYRADLLARLESEYKSVEYIRSNRSIEELKELGKPFRELLRDYRNHYYKTLYGAAKITKEQAEMLSNQRDITENERLSLERFRIADWGVREYEDLDLDYIKGDRKGKRRKELEKLEMQAFPQIAESLDKSSFNNQARHGAGISHLDISHHLLRVTRIKKSGYEMVLEFALSGAEWDAHSPEVLAIAGKLTEEIDELKALGITFFCGKKSTPVSKFNCVLKYFGLGTKRNRRRGTYQLDSESLKVAKADLLARLPRHIERYGDLEVNPESQWIQDIWGRSTPFETIGLDRCGSSLEPLVDNSLGSPVLEPEPVMISTAPIITTPEPESEAKSTAPKYQKGDRVWFLRAGEWIKGTVQAVYQGIMTEYNCLDPKGMGFFTKEEIMNPV